jgi:hypothetical protein
MLLNFSFHWILKNFCNLRDNAHMDTVIQRFYLVQCDGENQFCYTCIRCSSFERTKPGGLYNGAFSPEQGINIKA